MSYNKKTLKGEQKNQKSQKNLVKETRGITLIALVITVIVMLILAGVAISVLTDDGGMFEKTRGAAEAYENAAEREADQLNTLMNEVDQHLEELSQMLPITKQELEEKTSGLWNGTVNTPKLAKGMVAVYWNEAGKEKELTSSSSKSEWNNWYSYTAQSGTTENPGSGTSKWANAVTKDENGKITGYWVWIPRYEYKLTTSTKKIEVNFISTDTTTASTGYKVHPAFINNPEIGGWDSEIPGFWVAKYPAGYQKSTVNESGTLQNGNDTVVYSNLKYTQAVGKNAIGQDITSSTYASTSISYPVFKPLTYAYTCINIDSMFRISQDIKNNTSFYGLTNSTDSHLMKNSEWGAVAYLAWSQYGRNGTEPNINNVNLNNKDNKSIYQVTGIVADTADIVDTSGSFTGNVYYTSKGQLGSTTGNITGVYDMNGCVREYVTGYIYNSNGSTSRNTYGASLVASELASKYRTIYPHNSGSDRSENNWGQVSITKIYGDAVKETSTSGLGNTSWNSDQSRFPAGTWVFFIRGGLYFEGEKAGLFAFYEGQGYGHYYDGFRVCLIAES